MAQEIKQKYSIVASAYLLFQSIAASLWWIWILSVPESRRYFFASDFSDNVIYSLILPDAILFIGTGFLAAWGIAGKSPWFWPLLVLHCGAVWYAAIFAFSSTLLNMNELQASGLLGSILMIASGIMTSLFVWTLRPNPEIYSLKQVQGIRSPTPNLFYNQVLTLSQIIVVWSIFLFILPTFVLLVEEALGIPRLRLHPFLQTVFILLAVTAALSNLTLAWFTTSNGQGTPLPFAAMSKLITTGPYAYIRNPMLLISLLVGIFVSISLGSSLMVLFFAGGAFFWNTILRPWEERDLQNQFGLPYKHYRKHVRCWLPRLTAYKAPKIRTRKIQQPPKSKALMRKKTG